ncbi:hypothetical protein [Xanthomonas graminis]|nr:hypothetical protein [Xanthomonas translucens]WIH11936.1 hypothetical protein KM563_17970 [Xanthomonas translucens pv. graminis]
MRNVTSEDIQCEQDRVAAISDAALPPGSAPMMTWDGYSALQPRPEHTPDQLLRQIAALARSLHAQADSDPNRVERILGVALPPDTRHERRGVSGTIGKGRYDWAVWKPSPKHPGHLVELTVTENACLAYDTSR